MNKSILAMAQRVLLEQRNREKYQNIGIATENDLQYISIKDMVNEIGKTARELDELKTNVDAGRLISSDHKHDGSTSDGYHTFDELYHHRAILFSVIVRNYSALCWKSKLHHDGTMYDGMFIVGINTPEGQASYHYNLSPYWNLFDCKELERAPEWDGHTPSQAIERIGKLTSQIRYGRWKNGDGIYDTCTVCGEKIYRACPMHYCPLCGAKMEGE